MYIDNYKVEIKGTKYHEKTDKKMTDQVLATYQSDDGIHPHHNQSTRNL